MEKNRGESKNSRGKSETSKRGGSPTRERPSENPKSPTSSQKTSVTESKSTSRPTRPKDNKNQISPHKKSKSISQENTKKKIDTKVPTAKKRRSTTKYQWPDLALGCAMSALIFWLGVASWVTPANGVISFVEGEAAILWSDISCLVLIVAGLGCFIGGGLFAVIRFIEDDTGRGWEKSAIGRAWGWLGRNNNKPPPIVSSRSKKRPSTPVL